MGLAVCLVVTSGMSSGVSDTVVCLWFHKGAFQGSGFIPGFQGQGHADSHAEHAIVQFPEAISLCL